MNSARSALPASTSVDGEARRSRHAFAATEPGGERRRRPTGTSMSDSTTAWSSNAL